MRCSKVLEHLNQINKKCGVIEKEWKDWIDEYVKINEELKDNLKEVSDTDNLYNDKEQLEEKLETKNEEIENTKEELKQKNPSYARAQKRYNEKRRPKIPEMVMIPNK